MTIGAKIGTSLAPLLLKIGVETLTAATNDPSFSISMFFLYGIVRSSASAMDQFKNASFQKVLQTQVRKFHREAFRRMHDLSWSRHTEGLQNEWTGVQRGIKGIETLMRVGLVFTVPAVIEFSCVLMLLSHFCGWAVGATVTST